MEKIETYKDSSKQYDMVCLEGVVYWVYMVGNLYGLAPKYDTDGKIVLCKKSIKERLLNGEI